MREVFTLGFEKLPLWVINFKAISANNFSLELQKFNIQLF